MRVLSQFERFEALLGPHPRPATKYDACETLGEALALWCHDNGGAQALHEFFEVEQKHIDPRDWLCRESLIDAGDELAKAGLITAAKIVHEVAKTHRSMIDPFFCESFNDPRLNEVQRAGNVEGWLKTQQKMLAEWQKRRETNAVKT
jgi:hypothetical protein